MISLYENGINGILADEMVHVYIICVHLHVHVECLMMCTYIMYNIHVHVTCKWLEHVYVHVYNGSIELLSKGHFGTSHFVPCREVVLFSEVEMYTLLGRLHVEANVFKIVSLNET